MMCDICKAKQAGMSDIEAHAGYLANMWDTIELYGIGLTAVEDATPPFIYTLGRTLLGEPELYMAGYIPIGQMAGIMNALTRGDEKPGAIVAGQILDGFLEGGFSLKFVPVDPVAAEMNLALTMFGTKHEVTGLQVLWQDEHHHFPDCPDYTKGRRFYQPLHPVTS